MTSAPIRAVPRTSSAALPVRHLNWDESHNILSWDLQSQFIVWCQSAPGFIVFPPALFFHFFLKRDWGMAFGPFFAFAIYSDIRALDLFLAASIGGVFCGVLKHIFRSPRPFWLVPEVRLKQGVEEMSWGTPSAHSAIQGAISAVLIYHDARNWINWVVNALVLLFCMYSRLYLAVHWPQDVVVGAVVGVISGLVVCASTLHPQLISFVVKNGTPAGLIFSSVGACYFLIVWVAVKGLTVLSDKNPVPDEAILRYKLGVLRALRVMNEKEDEDTSTEIKLPSTVSICFSARSLMNDVDVECVEPVNRRSSLVRSSTISDIRTFGRMFGTLQQAQEEEDEEERRKRKRGVFFREDIPFNPDSKVRFWYNAINVVGAYCGVAFFTCLVERQDVEFKPTNKWIAAFYAMNFSFAAIVYTRTILRSLLQKKIFKWVRFLVYWFCGFFTYGLFPLSYTVAMK